MRFPNTDRKLLVPTFTSIFKTTPHNTSKKSLLYNYTNSRKKVFCQMDLVQSDLIFSYIPSSQFFLLPFCVLFRNYSSVRFFNFKSPAALNLSFIGQKNSKSFGASVSHDIEPIISLLKQDKPFYQILDRISFNLSHLTTPGIKSKSKGLKKKSISTSKNENETQLCATNFRDSGARTFLTANDIVLTIEWLRLFSNLYIESKTNTILLLKFLIDLLKNISRENVELNVLLSPKLLTDIIDLNQKLRLKYDLHEINSLTNEILQLLVIVKQYDTAVDFVRSLKCHRTSDFVAFLHTLAPVFCKDSIPVVDDLFLGARFKIPWGQLAGSIHGPRFILISHKITSRMSLISIDELIDFLKNKIFLGDLDESVLFMEALLKNRRESKDYLEFDKLVLIEQVFQSLTNTSLSFVHIRIFNILKAPRDSWSKLLILINQQLKNGILASNVAVRLTEVIINLSEQNGQLIHSSLFSLINIYCRCGNMDKVKFYLDRYLEAGFQIEPSMATMLLYCHSKLGIFSKELLQNFENWGLSLNIFHLTQLVISYTQNPQGFPGVLSVVNYIKESNGLHVPDEAMYVALIEAFTRFNKPQELHSCMLSLNQHGSSPSIKHYTSLIGYFERHKLPKNLESIIQQVYKNDLTLDLHYTKVALKACETCSISTKKVEKWIGPRLALQSRTPEYLSAFSLLIDFISSDSVAFRCLTIRFLDAWASSIDPLASRQLIKLFELIVKINFEHKDAYLLSLIYYNFVATSLPDLGYHPQSRRSHLLPIPSLNDTILIDSLSLGNNTIFALKWGLNQLSKMKK